MRKGSGSKRGSFRQIRPFESGQEHATSNYRRYLKRVDRLLADSPDSRKSLSESLKISQQSGELLVRSDSALAASREFLGDFLSIQSHREQLDKVNRESSFTRRGDGGYSTAAKCIGFTVASREGQAGVEKYAVIAISGIIARREKYHFEFAVLVDMLTAHAKRMNEKEETYQFTYLVGADPSQNTQELVSRVYHKLGQNQGQLHEGQLRRPCTEMVFIKMFIEILSRYPGVNLEGSIFLELPKSAEKIELDHYLVNYDFNIIEVTDAPAGRFYIKEIELCNVCQSRKPTYTALIAASSPRFDSPAGSPTKEQKSKEANSGSPALHQPKSPATTPKKTKREESKALPPTDTLTQENGSSPASRRLFSTITPSKRPKKRDATLSGDPVVLTPPGRRRTGNCATTTPSVAKRLFASPTENKEECKTHNRANSIFATCSTKPISADIESEWPTLKAACKTI